MKKIVNVNIAGLSYVIDQDGYDLLRNYLRDIELRIPNKYEAKEMLEDIEARISDLFNEMSLISPRVVTIEHVQKTIDTIGDPDVFGQKKGFNFSQTFTQTFSQTFSKNENTQSQQNPSRRLMRDGTDSIISGLCSGVAAYLSMDTSLLRILAVVIGVISGFLPLIIAYVVCIFVVPQATTPEDLELMQRMKNSRK